MNYLKQKMHMKTEVSLVDRTDGLGAVTTGKQLCHHQLVGVHRMKQEYNYDHAQGNNLSTIRD